MITRAIRITILVIVLAFCAVFIEANPWFIDGLWRVCKLLAWPAVWMSPGLLLWPAFWDFMSAVSHCNAEALRAAVKAWGEHWRAVRPSGQAGQIKEVGA